ncbi:aminotransferase class I/II-fold pyridoxal phosphate-dependent enzyme [Desulfovibrio mangrovi]|uniref:pyridoxal phosphate-dependent aminotransferase n=1 Tax=Desulfovibrio mangrovi TaxID=2976983 RepID=UPI0022482A46|nr:aminotransferase class I/II-fold pyridoxal phosphate-dependent enzyme [Desulfovibrio mangrovi]UZP68881.1 aminotransferase class I/II-fold pyridoxal phosphate-dependent enzyme [Desulfovibrio mangrovi]
MAATKQTQGTHGGEVYRLARSMGVSPDAILDFSSNANSLCDDLTRAILGEIDYPYRHYPDTWCSELRDVLARHENVSPESILVGNGSSENIFLTIQQLRPRHVVMLAPIFSEYVRACEAFGVPYTLIPCSADNGFACREHELNALRELQADLAIICSPNNPACVTYDNMADILSAVQASTILVDNTYSEFLWGLPAYEDNRLTVYRELVNTDTQVITVQSFTKFFYCTGVRLGYSVASPALTERLAAGKTPWTVSAYAEQAGIAFMNSMQSYRDRLHPMREERRHFVSALQATGAFAEDRIFSGVNYVTAGLKTPERSQEVYASLLEQGILVRVCDNIPGMPAGYLRMQVREESAWRRLTAALHSPT